MKHIVPFFIGRNGLARYETKSQGRRGLCLIINNKNFHNANAIRTGCEYDEEKLKNLKRARSIKCPYSNHSIRVQICINRGSFSFNCLRTNCAIIGGETKSGGQVYIQSYTI